LSTVAGCAEKRRVSPNTRGAPAWPNGTRCRAATSSAKLELGVPRSWQANGRPRPVNLIHRQIACLGQGRELRFDNLMPGWHTITLRVTDGDGLAADDSVSLLIGSPRWVPLILVGG